ncbi:hypothetical protein NR798_45540 [Archangium gephyra]|uniref:hypothetical protein n=1 Tax=Archangium gephyra TaxID=48 RepID=UPI0035D3E589
MTKGGDRQEDGIEEQEARGPEKDAHVFDKPATLREPAAPRVPRVQASSPVGVIPLPGEEQARASEARPETLQQAREATDALLHEILEEDFLDEAPEPRRADPPAQPSREEDWPTELHSLHLPEEP